MPRTWLTVETILEALCGLAERSTNEERWPDDEWSSRTFKGEVKMRWTAVLDHWEGQVPELPPPPQPPATPSPRRGSDDPWAAAAPATGSTFDDEPPF